MAKSALPAPNMLLMAIPVVFLIVWTGMAAFMGLMAMSHGAPAIFGLFAGGFVLIGFLGMGAVIKRGIRISTAEVEARPAILRGKRTHVSGGGESSTTTHYHATFEFKSGERQEFSVDWRLYGELAEDDAGILFSRAEIVEKFQRM
jgi:hypothetical protein